MKSYVTLALVLLVLAFPMKAEPKSEDKWINFSGHGMSFEYPAEWSLVDNPTGVVVGDKGIFGLSIVMHKEGCYPLSQHPQLLDFMIKLWSREMDGTPDGEPITQYLENEMGPYSNAMQIYKDPEESLMCELQGYIQKDITVTYAEVLWKPQEPAIAEDMPKMARLMKSLIVTLPDKVNVSSIQA